MERLTIEIKTLGVYTEQEIQDYIIWQLSGGSIDNDNPFINEECEAEIVDCKFY